MINLVYQRRKELSQRLFGVDFNDIVSKIQHIKQSNAANKLSSQYGTLKKRNSNVNTNKANVIRIDV